MCAQLIQLYKDEKGFIEYYKQNLLNKTTVTFDKIKTAGQFLGRTFDISCGTCAKNSWRELQDIFNTLTTKDIQKEIEPLKTDEIDVYTKLEYEEIKKTKSKK